MDIFLILLGVALLYFGGEFLVRSATDLAQRLGVNPFIIGLTVVAFGTSSPELAATITSAVKGVPEVAIGNVLGSNIANIGLILALTAIFYPLISNKAVIRQEIPIMLLAMALTIPVLWDGAVTRAEGGVLFGLLIIYLLYQLRQGADDDTPASNDAHLMPVPLALLGTAAGIALLVGGAQSLVTGGVNIAEALGVPDRVIGLTLVALGTSLPELSSSLVAALRRETGLILGGIIGSNIFNVLAILGLTSIVSSITLDASTVWIDVGVMMALGILLFLIMLPRQHLGRIGGVALFASYCGYIVWLFMKTVA